MFDQPRQIRERPAVSLASPPILFDRTQQQLGMIEAALGEPLLTYWNASGGSICANDAIPLYNALRHIGHVPRLSLFVKSGGGSGEASLRMVHLLRQHTDHLTILVPLECESAATMLALGANRILMGPLAHLSAVDTSLTHDLSPLDRDNRRVKVSQDELDRVARLWQSQPGSDMHNPYAALFQYVHPLVIGAVDRASALSTRLCLEILNHHMTDPAKAEAISNTLNSSYPSHSYPITLPEARRIGLDVAPLDDRLNSMLLELNALYCEMGQVASTDFDERNSHDESILSIIEAAGAQLFYQTDKDWHYRAEERRWIGMNDRSSWRKAEHVDGQTQVSVFHIR